MIALGEDSYQDIAVFAVNLETVVQAHACSVHKSLEGFLVLAVQKEESAISLIAPAEGNHILFGESASLGIPPLS